VEKIKNVSLISRPAHTNAVSGLYVQFLISAPQDGIFNMAWASYPSIYLSIYLERYKVGLHHSKVLVIYGYL